MTAHPLLRLVRLAHPLRRQLALGVLAGTLATGCGVALLAVSGWLIARAAEHPSVVALTVAVVGVRAFGVGRGVFRYAERLLVHDAAFRVLADVRVTVFRRLERLAPAGLADTRAGDLLTRLVGDVESVQDLLVRGIAPPLVAALVSGGAVVTVTALLAGAGVALAGGLLAAGVALPWLSARLERAAGGRQVDARAALATEVVDVLDGAAELAAYGALPAALDRAAAVDGRLSAIARRSARVSGLGAGLTALASGLTVWAALLLGVAAVERGALGRVPLAVVVLTALAAFEAVAPLPAVAAGLGALDGSARRLFAVLDRPDPVAEPEQPVPLPSGPVAVRLRDVRVAYRPGQWALDGVDLELAPGRRVALVGPSGAGKSTVASLLFRFRDPDAGEVSVGGVDVRTLDPDELRGVVGGVPQDPHVFATTLRDNLALASPGESDAGLDAAADRARLLGWVRSLPEGWDTQVGTRGSRMSGGERQRLALARALLADPPVLVLDEPTAHLDAGTARAVMHDVLAATTGRTVLLVTHDLTGLQAVDEVVVLDAGRVVERGSQDQLLAAGGRYAAMWRLQQAA